MRKNAKENQVGVLVVIGGDGTIHHAVQNFKDTIRDYQIGIIPGGTVNNFARVLSIPLKKKTPLRPFWQDRPHQLTLGW